MTKRKEAEQQDVTAEPQNDSPNPPTTEVPEEGAPPYPPEDAVLVEAAPVWHGGDPGTAVPSPANEDDTYYHPETTPPPPEDPDTDGDGTPDSLDDDDDDDGILDVDEVPVTREIP
jgi:hypothetical protein